MVRIAVTADSDTPTPLHLAVLSATGQPIVRLRVDVAEYWTLERVTVLSTPDNSLVGAPFPHLNHAMGQLKRFLPRPAEAHAYLELLHAYIVGPLELRLLGTHEIHFKLYGESVSTRHSPELATAPVQCFETEPAEKGGRWLPVSVLRPFVPPALPDREAAATVKELMAQGKHVPFVKEMFRRARPLGAPSYAVDWKKTTLPAGMETVADMLARQGGGIADITPGPRELGESPRAVAEPRGSKRKLPTDGKAGDGGDGPRGDVHVAGGDARAAHDGHAAGAAQAGGKRHREQWFDKLGNVVVARPVGEMALPEWPTCLVIVGKKHGPAINGSSSPKYVVTEALPPARGSSKDKDTWHVTEVEPLRDALPKVWRALLDGQYRDQDGKQRMVAAIVHAVQRQMEKPGCQRGSLEATWDWLVPEAKGRWLEVTSLHGGA